MDMSVNLFVYYPIKLTAEKVLIGQVVDLLEFLEQKYDKLTYRAVDVETGMQLNMNNGKWTLKE